MKTFEKQKRINDLFSSGDLKEGDLLLCKCDEDLLNGQVVTVRYSVSKTDMGTEGLATFLSSPLTDDSLDRVVSITTNTGSTHDKYIWKFTRYKKYRIKNIWS